MPEPSVFASIIGGLASEYAKNKAIQYMTGGKKETFMNAKQLLVDKSYTPAYKTKKKKRKKKKSSGKRFTKKQKASIKRLANQEEYELVRDQRQCTFSDLYIDYNKVRYALFQGDSIATLISVTDYEVPNPAVTTGALVSQELSSTLEVGAKVKFHTSLNLHLANNTNMPGEIRFVLWKCTKYTSVDPFTELEQMRDAHYGGLTTVAMADDFLQYFSVPGQKRDKWRKKDEWKINLRGGEHTNIFVDCGKFLVDINRWIQSGSTTYAPGSYYLEARAVGQLTHSNVETSVATTAAPGKYQNQMVGSFAFDFRKDLRIRMWVKGAEPRNPYINLAPIGLVTPADNTQQPVMGDPEIPDVAVPDQA